MINGEYYEERPVEGNVERRWQRPRSVFLGLGSNLGDREDNLRQAIERIKQLGLPVLRASSIYETEPVGYSYQSWFLNQVIEVGVDLQVTFAEDNRTDALRKADAERNPDQSAIFWVRHLLGALLKIEREMGRKRDMVNGPRTIDIDILIYGAMAGSFATEPGPDAGPILCGDDHRFLTVPHTALHTRRFVLEPLCEIAPDLVHPVYNKTIRELLATLNDSSAVRLYKSVRGPVSDVRSRD